VKRFTKISKQTAPTISLAFDDHNKTKRLLNLQHFIGRHSKQRRGGDETRLGRFSV
jgi:hypothetical protein